MEFACHTGAFNYLTLTDVLDTIARLGFRYVDYVDIGNGPHPINSLDRHRGNE